MKLSICMMIKNEAEHLNECLTSLQPFFKEAGFESELIIVDTGSTDESVKIASTFTDKIYFHEWNNDFSAMRNITLSYATGEWVFIIDGDEVLYNAENIIEFLQHPNSKNFNTGALLIKSWIDSKLERFTALNSFRLFRRDKELRYEGRVHNQPIFKQPLVNFTEAELIHYGYISNDKALMDKKFERTATILKEELAKNPEHIYYWYQLGESYGLHGEKDLALDAMMKAYELVKLKGKNGRKDYMYVFIGAGKRNMVMNKPADAEKILKEISEEGKDYPDVHYFLGHALFVQGKVEEALTHYEQYIFIVENFKSLPSALNLSVKNETVTEFEKVYKIMAEEYYKLENYERAEIYLKAYEKAAQDSKLAPCLLYALYKQGKIEEIFSYYQYQYNNPGYGDKENLNETIEHIYHQSNDSTKCRIAELFKSENTDYGVLCEVRYLQLKQEIGLLIEQLEYINLAEWSIKSGELIWLMIKNNVDIIQKTKTLYEVEINDKFEEVIPQLLDLNRAIDGNQMAKTLIEYCTNVQALYKNQMDITFFRGMKILSRFGLLLPDLEEATYQEFFNLYVRYGTGYLSKIYNIELLQQEAFQHMKNQEDKILTYLWKATTQQNSNLEAYVYYLSKALEIGGFERGIRARLEEVRLNIEKPQDEMEKLKNVLKSNIRDFIQNKSFMEANSLIQEYEKLVENDAEILLLKTQILLGENGIH